MEEEKKSIIYKLLKQRDISTLDLHRTLARVGVVVSKKTLHTYLKDDFENARDERLKVVALEMLKNYDDLITKLKKTFEHE